MVTPLQDEQSSSRVRVGGDELTPWETGGIIEYERRTGSCGFRKLRYDEYRTEKAFIFKVEHPDETAKYAVFPEGKVLDYSRSEG